jgi:hypothetical protein
MNHQHRLEALARARESVMRLLNAIPEPVVDDTTTQIPASEDRTYESMWAAMEQDRIDSAIQLLGSRGWVLFPPRTDDTILGDTGRVEFAELEGSKMLLIEEELFSARGG